MPRYEFLCRGCGYHNLVWRESEDCSWALCPDCEKTMERFYTRMGMPGTQSSRIDNQEFNNGRGVYDRGLGEVVTSRKHRREIMERKGLHELSKYDRDLVNKEHVPHPMSHSEAMDQYEKAVARVKSGEWKEGLSGERIQEIESGDHRREEIDETKTSKVDPGPE